MKRTILPLSILLALQVALAASLWVETQPGQAKSTALSAIPKSAVRTIQISQSKADSKKNNTLKLVQKGKTWHLPSASGFPANELMVGNLLDNLTQPPSGLPVAQSTQARQRLQVGKNDYQSKIVLQANGQTRAIYIGKTAGAGRVYARGGNSSDIYALQLSSRLLGTKTKDWYDTTTPDIDTGSVQGIRLSGFSVQRKKKSGWQFAKPKQHKQKLDAGKTADLVRRLTHPSFKVVHKKAVPKRKPIFHYSVQLKNGPPVHYRYYATSGKNGKAFFIRSDQPWRYQISSDTLKKIRKTDVQSVVSKEKPGTKGKKPKHQSPQGKQQQKGSAS